MYSRGSTGLSTFSQPERKPSKNQRVKVWARVRPTAYFDTEHLELLPDGRSVNIHQKKESPKGVVNNQILDWSFRLDGIFHNASQDQVFECVASDIVTSALDGYNGTMMCYGQTGAGKTFTITGATESYKQRGILPRAISQLFKEIEERPEYSITVRVSYLEIYNESMVDLLATLPEAINQDNGQAMSVAENQYGVYVKGLSCHLTQNEEEALNYLFEGETNRAIAAHSLNAQSSRSHCIFTLYIETRSRVQSDARYTVSKLNLVDLAGSERLGKTKSDGKTQQEAMYINKSLTFLEQVIVALADRRREHIPFRQSKLTHCLKDSIGGNCNTLLIANVWGEKQQLEETVSTLRFATRMMCVASEPAMNEIIDPVIQVKRLEKEIQHLRHELAMHDTLTNRSHITYDPLSEQQRYEIRQQVRRYLEGHLDEIDIINIRQVQGVFDSFKDIYVQMEKDVEERLRQKFTLIDRTDPAAIAAAQQAGLAVTDEGLLVGETDGLGFGVGMAPKSAKADPSSVVQLKRKEKEREKKGKLTRQDTKSPTGGKSISSPSHSAKGEREVKSPHPSVDRTRDEDAATPASSIGGVKTDRTTRASTPPSRTTAFDIFKSEKGTELNRILVENKDVLAANKKSYSDLARGINGIKVEIDQCRMLLEKLKEERESNGAQYNEEGDIIISEEEFLEVKKLKELKAKYKNDFEELKNLKAKVQYCQRLVDNCRQKLIQEFDKWYSESFLSVADDGSSTSMNAGHGIRPGVLPPFNPNTVPEDEQEKFDRLQMELLMNNPDSAAYFNAQHRTQRRKTYETAMMQPQPSYRRSPGQPTISIRNRPPNMLQVSQ